ncbi:unnamed protein product [Lepeophtheirus salmonis]|uniref:(salmon louse) hypothetical protein n=1 Tax=Lepeophtheirus salmonis TaxID=72036 RepID=A0A7R8H1T3_LEPSM|nr:unnamed protein product [Lepeophtheirus salmonis]CAF2815909.1 unnamed protein product [Lepeophtheirus salmonis]
MVGTITIETITVTRPMKVIAFVCTFITTFLMIAACSTTDWVVSEDFFGTLLTGLGLRSTDPNKKYKYYRVAIYSLIIALLALLLALIIYPVSLSKEIPTVKPLDGGKIVTFEKHIGDLDFDNDGIPDHLDLDDDNDGKPDTIDDDDDNDGILDTLDMDDDNDGIPDSLEEKKNIDLDGDGIPNDIDDDDDGDGQLDSEDSDDDDNDGIPDSVDKDDDNDNIPDVLEEDSDGDGEPDILDRDDDNDGVPDEEEELEIKKDRQGSLDTDKDGIPDLEDQDDDNDGIIDSEDNDDDNDGIPDDEDTSGDPRVWSFGFAYGASWASAILLFLSVILLICDRESEEIFYKERVGDEEEGCNEEDA